MPRHKIAALYCRISREEKDVDEITVDVRLKKFEEYAEKAHNA